MESVNIFQGGYQNGGNHPQETGHLGNFGNVPSDSSLVLSHLDVPDQVRGIICDGLGSSATSIELYLTSIDQLQVSVDYLERVLRSGKELMSTAMSTLETSFDSLLRSNSISPDPQELKAAMLSDTAPDHIRPPEVIAGNAVDQLHAIARRLVDNGHGSAARRLYRECRGKALERNFDAMQVMRLPQAQVQKMAWGDLEKAMQKWNEHMHIGMIFVAAEREACDLVLDELEPIREQCFVELCQPCVKLLTSFGMAVAGTRKSPEKLFALLDMYETALDLRQTVDDLFAGREGGPVRSEYLKLLTCLGTAAKETFEKFEEAVKEQPTIDEGDDMLPVSHSASSRGNTIPRITSHKSSGMNIFGKLKKKDREAKKDDDAATDVGSVVSTPAGAACAGGKVHPLASYVINYVIILCNGDLPYFGNLEHAVGESLGYNAGTGSDTGSVSTTTAGGLTKVQCRIAFATKRILDALKEKLVTRASAIGDDVLAELFLTNNMSYIYNKIEMSDAGRLLGVAWCGECANLVEYHRDLYVRNALAKFDPVFAEGALDNAGLVSRLSQFNSNYDRLRQRQLSWSIPNAEVRDYVRNAVSSRLVERYNKFLTRAGPLIQQQKTLKVKIMSCKEVSEGLEKCFPETRSARN